MEKLGIVNKRVILFQKHDLEINWSKSLPDTNWIFVAFVETGNYQILDEIARKIIDMDVCYACCIGTFGEKLHDLIDDNLVIRETEIEKLHVPSHHVMTTWHGNITNGFWFALYAAQHETVEIDKLYCLDIGNNSNKDHLVSLINKFNSGYIPKNE